MTKFSCARYPAAAQLPNKQGKLEWHGRSHTLICRVVTKLGNKPNSIIGDFVDYLLARHQSRILAIHIMRR
jgi:hypothetical protein